MLVGWMDNWAYAQVLPTAPWRGRMTVARELSLGDAEGAPYLRQRPLAPTRTVTVDRPVTLAPGVRASYDGEAVLLERLPELVPGYAGRWLLPSADGRLDVVEDALDRDLHRRGSLRDLARPGGLIGDTPSGIKLNLQTLR